MVNSVMEMLGQAAPRQGDPASGLAPIARMRRSEMLRLCAAYEVDCDQSMRAEHLRQHVMVQAEAGKFNGQAKHPGMIQVVDNQPNGDPIYAMSPNDVAPKVEEAPETVLPKNKVTDVGDGWTVSWGAPVQKFRVLDNKGVIIGKGYVDREAAIADVERLKQL